MSAECECSEEYGPCEDHSEVLAQRGGAALRTADELLAVFIGDAIDIIRASIVTVMIDDGWGETASVWWEDGYVISRITGGPLHPDAAECVWCGRVDRCSDAGTGGQATCEDCWHRMDWHRSCEVGDPDTVCPMCGAVLASHAHPEYDR